jgi:predicted small lipoprotein YifL
MIYLRTMKPYQLLPILLLSPVMTGCGQPGPLYLPGSATPIHVEHEPKLKTTPQPEQAK